MARKLIVYGDVAMDISAQVDALPQLGQDAIIHQLALLPAGSAANCAAVAARLGAPVEFAGLTGRDQLASLLIEDLRHSQVGVTHLRQADGPAAVIIAVVDAQGERTMLSYRGVSTQLAYGEVAPDLIQPGDCLHLSGYSFQDPYAQATALAFMAQARARGALISLDPSFYFAQQFPTFAPLLAGIDLLFPNREEAYWMTGAHEPYTAVNLLHRAGFPGVVLKLGQEGCLLATAETVQAVPAYPVAAVVDTTGAGDAFCGGFLTAHLWGLSPVLAAKIGHAAAAYVIGQQGGHTGAPSLVQVIDLLTCYGDTALAAVLQNRQEAVRYP